MLEIPSIKTVRIILQIACGKLEAIEDLESNTSEDFSVGSAGFAKAVLFMLHTGRSIPRMRLRGEKYSDPNASLQIIYGHMQIALGLAEATDTNSIKKNLKGKKKEKKNLEALKEKKENLNIDIRKNLEIITKAAWKDKRSMVKIAEKIEENVKDLKKDNIFVDFPERRDEVVSTKMDELFESLVKSQRGFREERK
jgi:hypothetical protein